MDKYLYFVLPVIIIVIIFAAVKLILKKHKGFNGQDYTIPTLDLSTLPEDLKGSKYEYLYKLSVVDNSRNYMAHPDSVLLTNGDILTLYPAGHGKGAILNKISTDGGITWSKELSNTPISWEKSLETPTVYRLKFTDGKTGDKLIMISANAKWPKCSTPGGFNSSVSVDEGKTWTEFKRFYDSENKNGVIPIVAMASLTQLKENGKFTDKWMALFHDRQFHNYKTILTFDENGNEQWSVPEKYFAKYRKYEKKAKMCEVEVIRSDNGKGDELCLIARSNSKRMNSLISFSTDEGKTWSEPVEAPAALNGERHKADYTSDGKLFITFRSIERGEKAKLHVQDDLKGKGWMSEGLVAWVGTYDDLKNHREGQYRIKIAHIYNNNQTRPEYYACGDTGYCGNVVLGDDTIVTCGYGKFSPEEKTENSKELKTYICSKRINLKDTDELVKRLYK